MDYVAPLLEGLAVTVQLTIAASLVGLVLAFSSGLAQQSRYLAVRAVAYWYVEIFRGTSLLIQLFWLFYVLPLFGISLEPISVGIVTLGLNIGAYGSEVVRGAMQAVPAGQKDAAIALNLSAFDRFRLVMLPQSMVLMLAPFGNLMIVLLKGTSLVSLIAVTDLTFAAQNLRATEGNTTLVLFLVLVLYFAVSLVITAGIRGLENWFARKHGIKPPKTGRTVRLNARAGAL